MKGESNWMRSHDTDLLELLEHHFMGLDQIQWVTGLKSHDTLFTFNFLRIKFKNRNPMNKKCVTITNLIL